MKAEDVAWAVEGALAERSRVERRERHASRMMASMLIWSGPGSEFTADQLALKAVFHADALIAELDK